MKKLSLGLEEIFPATILREYDPELSGCCTTLEIPEPLYLEFTEASNHLRAARERIRQWCVDQFGHDDRRVRELDSTVWLDEDWEEGYWRRCRERREGGT